MSSRRERRALVRRWECTRYSVATFGEPTVDDVVRSRELGRRRTSLDLLAIRRELIAPVASDDLAERVRAILETSQSAYPLESAAYLVAWQYEHDGDAPTPFDRARAIKARREAQS